jgi:hypothetical protein
MSRPLLQKIAVPLFRCMTALDKTLLEFVGPIRTIENVKKNAHLAFLTGTLHSYIGDMILRDVPYCQHDIDDRRSWQAYVFYQNYPGSLVLDSNLFGGFQTLVCLAEHIKKLSYSGDVVGEYILKRIKHQPHQTGFLVGITNNNSKYYGASFRIPFEEIPIFWNDQCLNFVTSSTGKLYKEYYHVLTQCVAWADDTLFVRIPVSGKVIFS